MGGELSSSTPGKRGGGEGEREIFLSPVNIVIKSSNGIWYALLLVDYETCYHSSTGDIDEECDIEGERHLLSNHADIEATINNAIEHFLYEESFREEQKIRLKLVRRGQDVFVILPTGSGRPSFFCSFHE